jgi:hypothetical protein
MALADKIAQFVEDADIVSQIVHGSDTTEVAVEGAGVIPSLAKVIKDASDDLYDSADGVLAEAVAAKDTAVAAAAAASTDAAAADADRVQTGLDRTQTGLDRAQTTADAAATAADRVQTGLDRVQTVADAAATAADRIQTGVDRDIAITSATAADFARMTAEAQATLAASSALAAASVVQQDLSGTTGLALHRTNGAVVAQFVYDASKDADGGAWIEKCSAASWMNETLAGTWLTNNPSVNPLTTETTARSQGATVGPELNADASFDAPTGWGSYASMGGVIAGGQMVVTAQSGNIVNANALTLNRLYKVTRVFTAVSGTVQGQVGGVTLVNVSTPGTYTEYVVSTSTVSARHLGTGTPSYTMTEFSVKQVTAFVTAGGSYYQSSTDGKFYRLNTNLCQYSEFQGGLGFTANAEVTASTMTGYAGAVSVVRPAAGNADVFKSLAFPPGLPVSVECVVEMTDGLGPPVFSATAASADMTMYVMSTEYSTGVTITPLGGNFYKLSVLGHVSTATGAGSSGLRKTSTMTTRPFKMTAIHIQYGTSIPAYELKAAEGSITEVFRGNKAKFPRLAAIVAEASNITIYDLTEPGRPMWMRFVRGSSAVLYTHLHGSGFTPNNVMMLQGVLVITSTAQGATVVNFPSDRSEYRGSSASGNRIGGISLRNVESSLFATGSLANIGNVSTNGLAMCVMPDTQVDPGNGMLMPTIAITHSSGVSLIQPSGAVVSSAGTINMTAPVLTPYYLYLSGNGTTTNYFVAQPSKVGASFAVPSILGGAPISSFVHNANVINGVVNIGRSFLVRRNSILGKLSFCRLNETTPAASIAGNLGYGFNTGFWCGDVRRAWLSAIDAGTTSSANIMPNFDFATDIAGWTSVNSTPTWEAPGKIRVTNTASNGYVYRILTTVPGRSYVFTVDMTYGGVVGAQLRAATTQGGNDLVSTIFSVTGTHTVRFTASSTTTYIHLLNNGGAAGNFNEFDNIVIVPEEVDRSYKNMPLTNNGSVTKAPMATGADLVGYSGFSAVNYLREAYHADLDFGTGAWRASAWVTIPANNAAAAALASSGTASAFSFQPSHATFGVDVTHTLNCNTADWTKGTGWAGTDGDTLTCDGTQVSNSDVTWIAAPAISNGVVRRWTLEVVALSGTLSVFASTSAGITITGPGTYTVLGGGNLGSTINSLRMNAGGTCTVNISIADLLPAPILHRGSGGSGQYFELAVNALGYLIGTAYDGTTKRVAVSTTVSQANAGVGPIKAVLEYTGGTLTLKGNGAQIAQTTGAALLTLNNASATLTIGNNHALTCPFPGSISNVILGATVENAEQELYSYELEREMYRANARSTLPDAALPADFGVDDVTERWSVVTATNESQWNGLVRVSSAAVTVGSFSKIAIRSGVKLAARTTTFIGVDVTLPAQNLKEELQRRGEESARQARLTRRIDFDAIAAQTDFVLPTGWEAQGVTLAGVEKREGATKDWTRKYDGFKETISFAVAPGAAAWVQTEVRRIA